MLSYQLRSLSERFCVWIFDSISELFLAISSFDLPAFRTALSSVFVIIGASVSGMADYNSYEYGNLSSLFLDFSEDSYLGLNDWPPPLSPPPDPVRQENVEIAEAPRGGQLPTPSDSHASKLTSDVESLSPSCENDTISSRAAGPINQAPSQDLYQISEGVPCKLDIQP